VNDLDTIFEFGGGYGSMCRLAWNLCFRGRYLILDLEPFCSLQAYYLSTLGIPQFKEYPPILGGGFHSSTSSVEIDSLFAGESGKSLFIANWSLSESPTSVRDEVAPIVKCCDYFLISFQTTFDGIDNEIYFSEFLTSMPEKRIKISRLDHLAGNSIIFGAPTCRSEGEFWSEGPEG
jgi:hypothetical protein